MSACSVPVPEPIRWLVCWVAIEISTASPRPPPIWRAVLTRPEARPARSGSAAWVAAIVEGTIEKPIPIVVRIVGIITYWIAEPPDPIRLSASRPPVISTRPPPSTGLTPARPTSLPACEAQAKITSAGARNTSPVSTGDSDSTCCR